MHVTALLLSTLSVTLASAAMVHFPRADPTGSADRPAATGAGATANAVGAAGALDFGLCTPTMDFQLGRTEFGRRADIGTFFPTDATLVGDTNQIDAANPNIITNFICDQLINICKASDAAIKACDAAAASVAGLGTKDQSTADAFNGALGF